MRPLVSLCLALALFGLAGCKGDPNTPEYWDKALNGSKKTKEKLRVLDELREAKALNGSFAPMLHAQLQSQKHAEVKAGIAKILGEVRDPSSVQPLVDALDLGNTDSAANAMNKEIASALGAIGDPKAEPTLLKLLKVKDNYTKIEAINALGALKAKVAVEPLIAVATDEGEPFISKKAVQALGEIGDPKAVPALVKMMFKERRGISFYMESSFALYQIGQPSADALLPVIKGEDKELFGWAKENNIIEPALFAKSAQVLGDLHEARAEKSLLQRLGFDSEYLDIKLFVRMRMADALGRMRSKEAAKALAGMLEEEEATARLEYIRALTRIGGREAVPALLKSAAKGSWDAREPSIIGVAMLGDEREIAAFDKLIKEEEALTAAECKENPDYQGCDKPAELAKKHIEAIEGHKKRLSAAQACKDSACWAKKLDDPEAGVRERAAFEVGRSGNAELVEALTSRLAEKNLDTRLAIIQATDWLVHDSKDAGKRAQAAVSKLDEQIAQEKGKTEFVKVNEDLRRLAVKLKRSGS
ncbi:MAG: HEAT repeat domain-containing protein [Myxococcales bacterium]|nr:HEAT repeat domain-containing protein [Myxococcales bacterium]